MSTPGGPRAVFLDRDGTLMVEVGYCSHPGKVELLPGVPEGLARLRAAGYRLIIVTNQSGIGRGYFTGADYAAVHARFLELIGPDLIDATYMCADHPDHPTERRKPGPGMVLEAARDHGIDLAASWLIGDRENDLESGRRAGVRGILVQTGYGAAEKSGNAAYVAVDFAAAVEFMLAARHQAAAVPST